MRRAAVIVAGVLALAGCSGGGTSAQDSSAPGSPVPTATPTASASPSASGAGDGRSMAAFSACLAEHGVTVPSGGPGSGGGAAGGPPSGMPTDRPSGAPTDRPTGMPTDRPGGPASGMAAGGPAAPPEGGEGGPGAIPSGVDSSAWTAAQQACASLLPAGGPQGPSGARPTAAPGSAMASSGTADLTVFWACMSDHDVPAPSSSLPADLDRASTDVAAALRVCGILLPEGQQP